MKTINTLLLTMVSTEEQRKWKFYLKPKHRIVLLVVLCALLPESTIAQRVTYSQYMFNGLSINPAFAGSTGKIDISAVSRFQWAGFEGAPVTNSLAIHSPLARGSIGAGLQFTSDKIGLLREDAISANYGYRIRGRKGTFVMGLSTSFSFLDLELSEVVTGSINDPELQIDISERVLNMGTGLLYLADSYYLALSVPRLVKDKIITEKHAVRRSRDYFFTGGFMMVISPTLSLKPNFLFRASEGEPLSYNVNLNALINNKVWFGLSLRPPESVNIILELQVNERMKFGYAMDFILDQDLRQSNSFSYEFLLNYRIPLPKSRKVICPVYF